MGMAKDQKMESQDRWDSLAAAKGYRCKNCGSPIPYEEREDFFETGNCGYCDHQIEKLLRD